MDRSLYTLLLPRLGQWCLLLALLLPLSVNAQHALDSMERVLPSLSGKARIDALGELAFTYCFYDAERALHFGGLELQYALAEGDSGMIATAWNDIAAAYIAKGDFPTSIAINQRALGVRERLGDSLKVASSLSKLGHAEMELGQLDAALAHSLRAVAIYEAEGQAMHQSLLLNNVGVVYQRQGNASKALEHFQHALAIAQQLGNLQAVINAQSNVALLLHEKGNRKEAKGHFLQLVKAMDATGLVQTKPVITINLGVCYMDEARYDSALHWYRVADTLLVRKGDIKAYSKVKVDQGICLARMGAYAQAAAMLEAGARYADSTASPLQLQHAEEGWTEYYMAKGDYREAMAHQAKAAQYSEEVRNAEIDARLAEMDVRFETERREKELAQQARALASADLKDRNQQLVILVLAIVVAVAVLSVGWMVGWQRRRRRQAAQRAQIALQDERLRISRDLHDNIGAELTLISSALEVEALQAPEAIRPTLDQIGGYARHATAQLRETIWAIRSESIHAEGLYLRIAAFAQRICQPQGIRFEGEPSGRMETVLAPALALQVQRICQEALHNAVKHARCQTLSMRMEALPTQLQVTISDDGAGFEAEGASGGHGLANMRARAQDLGGTMALTTAAGKGCTLRFSIPLK